MPASASYYDHNGQIRTNPSAFNQTHQGGHAGYYSQQQAYGGGLYFPPALNPRNDGFIGGHHHSHQHHPASHHMASSGPADVGGHVSFDSQRRNLDVLNDFFGALKRGQIDPSSYNQVGRSLMPLQTGGGGGGGGIATDFMPQPPHLLASAAQHNPMAQHYYLPPIPNLRTKNDLEQMDSLLEQMQTTIYDNSGSSPTPNAHAFDLRPNASPLTRPTIVNDHYATAATHLPSPLTGLSHSSQSGGSPAVTPPSSGASYTSGHSPSASSTGMSPSSRQAPAVLATTVGAGTISYPQLPTSSGIVFPGSQAPATLASNFGPDDRPHRGSMLQGASRKVKTEGERPRQLSQGSRDGTVTASSPSANSDASGGSEPESYDQWLNNVKTIESLRDYVKTRLSRQEYDAAYSGLSYERGFNSRDMPEPPSSARLPLPSPKHDVHPVPLYQTLRLSGE